MLLVEDHISLIIRLDTMRIHRNHRHTCSAQLLSVYPRHYQWRRSATRRFGVSLVKTRSVIKTLRLKALCGNNWSTLEPSYELRELTHSLEDRYLRSLSSSGRVLDQPPQSALVHDTYVTRYRRNDKHKRLANDTVATFVKQTNNTDATQISDVSALVLDGPEAITAETLLRAGLRPENILVPNPSTAVVTTLRSTHQVHAWAGTVEAYLKETRRRRQHQHDLVWLDFMKSLSTHRDAICDAVHVVKPGGLLAFTLSLREGAPDVVGHSRAKAVADAITTVEEAAFRAGLELSSIHGKGLSDFVRGCGVDIAAGVDIASALNARDIGAIASSLDAWADRDDIDAPPRLIDAARRAAAAVPRDVVSAVWTPDGNPCASLTSDGGKAVADADARRVVRVAQAVTSFTAPGVVDASLTTKKNCRSYGGSVHLYVGQMAFYAFQVKTRAR